MKLDDLFEHFNRRLDAIEEKMEGNRERLARNEESIQWVKGHIQTTVAFVLAGVGALATWFFTNGK